MNPLFNALGGGQMPGAIGDFQRMMQQFQQFKATFQGDPEQEVRKLIASGKSRKTSLTNCNRRRRCCNRSSVLNFGYICCATI